MPTHPPDTRRASPLPPDQRRAAVVRAVIPVIVEHGDAVTTRQLAIAAGVSEGTIFNVFRDKDELIAAVVAAVTDQGPYERDLAAIEIDGTFEDRLEHAVEVTQQRIVDIWRLLSRLGPRHIPTHAPLPPSPALTAVFVDHADRVRMEPGEAAQMLRALTLTLTHPQLTATPQPAVRVVEVFLHGVGAR